MTTRPVKKLFDLEIDEISVVDRPANQHGLITFAKSAGLGEDNNQEDTMPEIFDSEGLPVDEDVLEHGDVVYDTEGNEFVFVEDGVDDDDAVDSYDEDDEYDEDRELVGVGKSMMANQFRGGYKARRGVVQGEGANAFRAGAHIGRNRKRYAAGGAGLGVAGVAGGAGYGANEMRKSVGDQVLEDLSKAVDDQDRNEIISKALADVEVYKAQADQMAEQLELLNEERIEEAFIAKAEEYNLPVSPAVLGPILKAVAEVLDDEQLDVLDALFESVGDSLYDEIGYVGDTDNESVLDQVDAMSSQLVGKSNVSYEAATVAAFEANPAMYEAYLAEQNGR